MSLFTVLGRRRQGCEKCSVQRSAEPAATLNENAGRLAEAGVSSGGRPLDLDTRAAMQSRFGRDLSHVRVHTDARAAKSAAELNARAYTIGHDIVFAQGRYSPRTQEGTRLIAHELVHVVQQARSGPSVQARKPVSQPSDPAEHEAESIAAAVARGARAPEILQRSPRAVQRELVVHDPAGNIPQPGGTGVSQTNAQTVEQYLQKLCSSGGVTVSSAGKVDIPDAFCKKPKGKGKESQAAASSEPTGCTCLCDLIKSKTKKITIEIDDNTWPHTSPDGSRVTAPSPNSPKIWGAASKSGKTLPIDPWLVLGHELCGHAWLMFHGKHHLDEVKPRGRGGHQETVKRENLIRKEHGIEERGSFKDPYCGESFWADKKKPNDIQWSSFLDECKKWRAEYNKKHKTNYKIDDPIP